MSETEALRAQLKDVYRLCDALEAERNSLNEEVAQLRDAIYDNCGCISDPLGWWDKRTVPV